MNKKRLLQLADHLENGRLGHEVFDFNQMNDVDADRCGTAGCALGECPIVWPDDWEWRDFGLPMLPFHHSTSHSAREWFDITYDQYNHLFIPNGQVSGKEKLSIDATRYEVAANIRIFVTENYRS